MGRKITLFNSYHTKENTVTNYCGLMMRLVYESSPKRFEQLLAKLIPSDSLQIGISPSFLQQEKKVSSVPDLVIQQEGYEIFFENKLTDWFNDDQLNRHIKGFKKNVGCKVLFLLCSEFKDRESNFKTVDDVLVVRLTYENLLKSMDEVCQGNELLLSFLDEFKDYLSNVRDGSDKRIILSRDWEQLLDVVNCGTTEDEVSQNLAYMCPEPKGVYKHKRTRYFGSYRNKAVNYVYSIDGVVVVKKDFADAELLWNNSTENDEVLLKRGRALVNKVRSDEVKTRDIQVFLLSDKRKVKFEKDSDGGMYCSKIYFNVGKVEMNQLVDKIDGKKWSDIKESATVIEL
mgnify:CR=1 FL=1